MAAIKTSGVYIVEKDHLPNLIVEVATAIPAFIGYTEKASNGNQPLTDTPKKITSMDEFRNDFGGAPHPEFTICKNSGHMDIENFAANNKTYHLEQTGPNYLLYRSIQLFYANGGSTCYIISVGDYKTDISADRLLGGLKALEAEEEPAIVVIPETTLLPDADACADVQKAMLEFCGSKVQKRFAILDIYDGYKDRKTPSGDPVQDFRNKIGNQFLSFGAAYYPWLNTSIVEKQDLSFLNISNKDVLLSILTEETDMNEAEKTAVRTCLADMPKNDLSDAEKKHSNDLLTTLSKTFHAIITVMENRLNLMPPGAALAGIYATVDNNYGVWKAPANIKLKSVESMAVNITSSDQEELNSPPDGKSVNAIRMFAGEGILVWGACTLDGNSQDWRYINIRRTINMLNESIRFACKAYVFEPNDLNTWSAIKNALSNFLTGFWKRGGLIGAVPEEAFRVYVGLGETMTAEDILKNIVRIKVQVAPTYPNKFIELTFALQMQTT